MKQRILRKLIYLLQRRLKPEMIGGFSSQPGPKGIRISNHTHISFPANLTLGEQVFIGHFNSIDCFQPVTLGRNVYISSYVSILTHSSHNSIRLHGKHYMDDLADLKALQKGPVEIGDFTQIGPHSTIMPGVKLGKGTMVAAYSYVKPGTYPDFAILRGNPAKVVGNTKEMDEMLLERYPELKDKFYLNEYD